MVAGLGSLRGFFSQAGELAQAVQPALAAGAALTSGGTSAALTKAATASGILAGTQQGQSTAISVQPGGTGQETAGSGEMGGRLYDQTGRFIGFDGGPRVQDIQQAGALAPYMGIGQGLIGQGMRLAQRFMQSPTGIAVGVGAAAAPVIVDQFSGQPKKLRVTRKMQREVKNAVMLFGIDAVAAQMGVDPQIVFYIITKKFRNDGPYVTKAAVRKTRQTVRKLKTMCDMYDDLRPPAKRATTRRAATTRITQVK